MQWLYNREIRVPQKFPGKLPACACMHDLLIKRGAAQNGGNIIKNWHSHQNLMIYESGKLTAMASSCKLNDFLVHLICKINRQLNYYFLQKEIITKSLSISKQHDHRG